MIGGYWQSGAEWRASIPFTNAEIVGALRAEADSLEAAGSGPGGYAAFNAERYRRAAAAVEESGRVTAQILGWALPRLVEVCALCGGKALYRYGSEGRCRAHRDQAPKWRLESMIRKDARSAAIGGEQSARDRIMRAAERHRAVIGGRKGRK